MDSDIDHFQRAVTADRETVLAFLRDIPPPTEPVHDYITDIDERCTLSSEIRQLHEDLGLPEPNAATLAFFMVAPTSQIREHLAILRNTPPEFMATHVIAFDLQAASTIYVPTNRSSPPESSTLLAPPTMMLGNQHEVSRKRAAEARDGHACLLSGMGDPEAAHIFPFSLSKKRFGQLHTLLQAFWGVEKAATWAKLYQDPAMTQSIANYLSLSRHLHHWFDDARLALKPLSQTSTTIKVQFHWLRVATLEPTIQIDASEETLADWAGLRETLQDRPSIRQQSEAKTKTEHREAPSPPELLTKERTLPSRIPDAGGSSND
ncbi:uncharacterized protein B0T15DRAFT_491219 [Chaetomium strumarium]|uniref:HNH nuclease domain-containing protein n=1 Tax=Chaetomium strumarium TaxID=1170767 RepID=A0AAJ0GYS8_9PEZI|nr:hypothetical protein B0T15DRAFT_491219 [Chaetomium strumarium]